MFRIKYTYKVKMLYNDGNTAVIKEGPFLSCVKDIANKYKKNDKEDFKYYWIYIEVKTKLFGFTVDTRHIYLEEWGQYDEF
jgi:hypothetical protein